MLGERWAVLVNYADLIPMSMSLHLTCSTPLVTCDIQPLRPHIQGQVCATPGVLQSPGPQAVQSARLSLHPVGGGGGGEGGTGPVLPLHMQGQYVATPGVLHCPGPQPGHAAYVSTQPTGGDGTGPGLGGVGGVGGDGDGVGGVGPLVPKMMMSAQFLNSSKFVPHPGPAPPDVTGLTQRE